MDDGAKCDGGAAVQAEEQRAIGYLSALPSYPGKYGLVSTVHPLAIRMRKGQKKRAYAI